jgi:hypothetical protein
MPFKDVEERRAYNRAYYQANKVRILERMNTYNQTQDGKKALTLRNWKLYGLIDSDGDNYEKLYQSYLQSTHCDVCKIEYKDSYDRCMDHSKETNLFRQFLCRDCNIQDRWLLH